MSAAPNIAAVSQPSNCIGRTAAGTQDAPTLPPCSRCGAPKDMPCSGYRTTWAKWIAEVMADADLEGREP